MTGDSIECYNCGRQNPGWAQICRSCGVRLDPTHAARSQPASAFPTDQRSLTSMAAALATIVLGIVVALFLSGLDPFDPAAVRESPTPTIEPEPSGSLDAEPIPSASLLPEPTPTATPGLPGSLSFGTGVDANGAISGATDVFGPADQVAYVLAMPTPFGVPTIGLQVVKLADDGTEQEVISAAENPLSVDPNSTARGVVCCPSTYLIGLFGPGQYSMRAYSGDTLIAEGRFQLSEG
jgi:hypothetical protein